MLYKKRRGSKTLNNLNATANKTPIRILQISYGMDRGGAETLIMNIYRNINRELVQFDFLLHSKQKTAYEDEINKLGGRIYHIPRFFGYNKLSYDLNLKRFLSEHPEYLILHDHLMDSAEETFKVAKKLGRITISHSHIVQYYKKPSDLIRYFFRRNLYRYSDYRFACSKEAGDWLYRKKAKFEIINNGIDTEKYRYNDQIRRKKRKELNISDNTLLITNIGRLVEQKNQKRLLDIFSTFYKTNRDSTLVIIGKGPLDNKLKTHARKLKIEQNVIFLGERNDVNEILMASDLFLFPSLFEGLGIVLIEAEATGLSSVLSNNIPNEVDLIPRLINRVYLKESNAEWAQQMKTALANRTIREQDYLVVNEKGYDIKDVAKKMESFYLNIKIV